MDFAAFPPELNSALMYAGVGSGPILAAAANWATMSAVLESAAGGYQAVISSLVSESWLGPAAVAMAAAVTPYVTWLTTAAAQCEQTAMQAKAAAAAYEAAFAMTVPPAVIAANRTELAVLVATNFLGQNTPAIMANQAHYAEMWAQDASAMYTYSGEAAAATRLAPFTGPNQASGPAAPAPRSAGALPAAGAALTDKAQSAVSHLVAVPQMLHGMSQAGSATTVLPPTAAGAGATGVASATGAPMSALSTLSQLPGQGVKHTAKIAGNSAGAAAAATGGFTANESMGLMEDTAGLGMDGVGLVGLDGGGVGLDLIGVGLDFLGADELTMSGGLGALGGLGGLGGLGFAPLGGAGLGAIGTTSAVMGQAASVGSLSIPQAWAAIASPAGTGASAAAPAWASFAPSLGLSTESSAAAAAAGAQIPYDAMALAGMAGRAMAGSGRGIGARMNATLRAPAGQPGATSDDPAAPPHDHAAKIGIVAELRGLVELRDSGILTEEEFTREKQRLLDR